MSIVDAKDVSRRDFIKIAGASIALAGLDGCTRMPAEHILPYVDQSPEANPGEARHYATAMTLDGYATGLIVESHEGRPTKVEGNPAHPASLGAAGAIEQASVLGVYDPDRAKRARLAGVPSSWETIAASLSPARLQSRIGAAGSGLHLLLEPTSSPLEAEMLDRIHAIYPDAKFHAYSPCATNSLGNAFSASAAGAPVVAQYDFENADVVLSIDADFLATGPFHLRYARAFSNGRQLPTSSSKMNRLYVIESVFSPTGSAADHRFAVRARDIEQLTESLWAKLGSNAAPSEAPEPLPDWLSVIADDLRDNRGRALVLAGDRQPPRVHALAHAINSAIGAIGRVVWYTPSPRVGSQITGSLDSLIGAIESRSVDTLICIGGNPSYATPGKLDFAKLIRSIPNVGYAGLYENETARNAHWFVPLSHYLEAWSDTRAYDGTLSIVQPLLQPLYKSKSAVELLAAIAGDPTTSSYELLRNSWRRRYPFSNDDAWYHAVQTGIVDGTASPRVDALPRAEVLARQDRSRAERESIDIVLRPDPRIHDGCFANNGWLQELPAPLTQLTWGNAAVLGQATADRIGVRSGDPVRLRASSREIVIRALVLPGNAEDTVSVDLGYGRAGAESIASGVGVNAYALLPGLGEWTVAGSIERASASALPDLAITQLQAFGRAPVREASLDEYRANPKRIGDRPARALTLYEADNAAAQPDTSPQWAMTIDTGTCIGCGGCVVACQAENNIPVVGAEEVRNGRAMHWLRIDRYFTPEPSHTDVVMQPMLCQHCEKAPCEYVCPVEATVHSPDGLNEMVYNRCVGTRFCSNNCPYKVRRFNWVDYNAHLTDTEIMVKNPDVTVRERGVMEKCTFCVQRIREAEIGARLDDRPLRSTDVRTACQQACPTQAIVFGSLTDPGSDVVRRRAEPRAYSALGELGTEPRVRYLARIRNVNPRIAGGG